jgi:hypothetical protein
MKIKHKLMVSSFSSASQEGGKAEHKGYLSHSIRATPPLLRHQYLSILLILVFVTSASAQQLKIRAENNLAISRLSQTIEISAKDLSTFSEKDLTKLHLFDATGRELLSQAVDTDYDELHKPDILIFQTDFAPKEVKTFTITAGKKREYKLADFKAYGRFVRERFDDFAWENDRIAHRTYGKALITWKGEPLTSSSIDIWSKRTSKMVLNEWYMVDNYHTDAGEGADYYSAGPTRGCGGSGIWTDNQLFVPTNFIESRVLSNGPIRVMFELVYEPFDVKGVKVSQVLRISLDAGSQLDHFETSYRVEGGNPLPIANGSSPLQIAIGLKKVKDAQKNFATASGLLTIWEPVEKNAGRQGLAVIVNPTDIDKEGEDTRNNLVILKPTSNGRASYWAGFAWDKAGLITTSTAWTRYIEEFTQSVASPINVTIVK